MTGLPGTESVTDLREMGGTLLKMVQNLHLIMS